MNDDIKEMLISYGHWCNDHNDALGCKSPSAMLMRSAPHLCAKDALKASKRSQVSFISDDDALAVDSAMRRLRTYSVILWRIIVWHYVRGNSIRAMTEHLNATEQGKFTRIGVQNLLERAHGYMISKLDLAATT